MAIKPSLGKLPFPQPPERFIPDQRIRHAIMALPLEETAILHLHKLPQLHRDPFDRMLICQALEHDCTILTSDALIVQYPIRTLW